MKRKLLLKTLLVAATLLTSTAPAWADGKIEFKAGNTIGAEDNSTKWYGAESEILTVGSNQTLTLKFKTYTATDAELTAAGVTWAWNDQMTHAINMWDGNDRNFYMKGCGWGWQVHKVDENTSETDYDVNSNQVYNKKTYGWANDYRTMIGTGADVVMTIKRLGSEIIISQEFTTSNSAKFYHTYMGSFGNANGDIWMQMTVENAHIDIKEDYALTDTEIPEITGTLIGKLGSTGRLANHGQFENFTIAPNGSLTLNFKHHSTKFETWGNWLIELADETRNIYTLSAGNKASWGVLKDNNDTENITTTNWPASDAELLEKIDGSSVAVTITRSEAKVTITAVHTPTSGEPFTLVSEVTPSETTSASFATQNMTVRLLAELSHLDLLPVSTTMSNYGGSESDTYGWTTYSNSIYALDFSDIEGLTAYKVIDRSGSKVMMEEVTGTVPANTGLLLKGTKNTSYNIPIVGTTSTNIERTAADLSGNLMVAGAGTTVYAVDGKTRYVLGVNGSKAEFQKIIKAEGDGTENVAPIVALGKAYLQFDGNVSARALQFEDEATGIQAVEDVKKSTDGAYFNLAGQRVAQPTKGLYIVNGKKVVIK